ncbi:Uncharacterized conserved protein [Moraxella atlantae]|uniref:Uncharacterized conserved protein n=1 Tax=Faucicola atlantae TaxID=34059 RepID=A0A378Q1G2_9GAMM|nr:hypothetical protein [Moraxella atlantae]STY94651.1 Uncharacterized conserved protein [Moraxella atlantae]
MLIFHHQAGVLTDLDEQPFALEKDMQKLVEHNLEGMLSLRLIRSEFTIKNSRIDTLAYDPEANAFVIIEFKRERNFSVIDQGVAYLSLMLEYKSDFIIRCRKPATSGGGYKAIVKCDEFCYTHLTIFNVLHSTVKLRLNCEYAVT